MIVSALSEICIKCNGKVIEDEGFLFCATCGLATGRLCDTRYTSFSQSYGILKGPYSRKSRFEKKLLASLRCSVNYVVDEDILKYLQSKKSNLLEICYSISQNIKFQVTRVTLTRLMHL